MPKPHAKRAILAATPIRGDEGQGRLAVLKAELLDGRPLVQTSGDEERAAQRGVEATIVGDSKATRSRPPWSSVALATGSGRQTSTGPFTSCATMQERRSA